MGNKPIVINHKKKQSL